MLLSKLPATVCALKRTFSRVHPLMVPLLLVGHELLLAKAARVTAVVVVGAFMHVTDVSARESLATHRAEEGPLEAVRVPSKAVCPRKRHAAFLTAERSDARVDYLD